VPFFPKRSRFFFITYSWSGKWSEKHSCSTDDEGWRTNLIWFSGATCVTRKGGRGEQRSVSYIGVHSTWVRIAESGRGRGENRKDRLDEDSGTKTSLLLPCWAHDIGISFPRPFGRLAIFAHVKSVAVRKESEEEKGGMKERKRGGSYGRWSYEQDRI